jgi:predicted nucleic acid-binding protein
VRVVVDTSVLLQGVTGAGPGASPIYRAWRARRFALLTSETQLEELAGGDVEAEWGDDE